MNSYKNKVGKLIELTVPLRVLAPEIKSVKVKGSTQQPENISVNR
jgi:hypothetical protein